MLYINYIKKERGGEVPSLPPLAISITFSLRQRWLPLAMEATSHREKEQRTQVFLSSLVGSVWTKTQKAKDCVEEQQGGDLGIAEMCMFAHLHTHS